MFLDAHKHAKGDTACGFGDIGHSPARGLLWFGGRIPSPLRVDARGCCLHIGVLGLPECLAQAELSGARIWGHPCRAEAGRRLVGRLLLHVSSRT